MLRVRDAMTREVVTLGPEASASEALSVVRERGIRHLPVVEGGRLVGLVSDRDLRDVSPPRGTSEDGDSLERTRLGEMMSTELATIHPLDTIEHAAREIYGHKIGCLPVVADGELAGIITASDMVQTLIELIGAHGRGSWIEVEVENKPGALASVTDVVRERQVNIASVFVASAQQATHRTIVLRLETTNPAGIARAFEESGYKVYTTESTVPVETTHEES